MAKKDMAKSKPKHPKGEGKDKEKKGGNPHVGKGCY